MSLRRLLLAVVLAASQVVPATRSQAEPRRKGPEPRATLALTLARSETAARIEAVLPDPALARPPRRAVSDILVMLGSDDGNVDNALALMNGVPGSARLFRARLVAVIAGRVHAHATATCGGWQQDVSTCRVACDGGIFALRRKPGSEGAFQLHLGAAAAREQIEEARTGVLVSPCERDGGAEVRLVPAGGAESASLDLAAE